MTSLTLGALKEPSGDLDLDSAHGGYSHVPRFTARAIQLQPPRGVAEMVKTVRAVPESISLDSKDEEVQVNTLLYSMGDEADDILRSFKLSAEDAKKYDTVVGKFEQHFVRRRNVIYERTKFNQRRQEPGEPVDTFITALYSLAEHCGYVAMHDEMIRDRIVVGLCDAHLSVKLQLEADLTLDKAVTRVRQAEVVKQQ